MRIIRIDVSHCNTPFKNNYHSPHIFRIQAESIIIHITFENGISGYGESAPRQYVTGETPESVASVIRDRFSSLLLGERIASVGDIENILDTLENKCRKDDVSAYLSALGAVDIALLDGLSKGLATPLSSLLGPVARDTIPYTIPIPLLPIDTIREMAASLTGATFNSVKVLMEESVANNVERLKLIRSIFGLDMDMSVEANGKWTYRQAIDNLNELKAFNITAVEQPVRSDDLEGLKNVRKMTGIPVMVDESMCTLSDAVLLIDSGACDLLNIKISKCGGLLKSKRIADFALSAGIRFQLGTHVGETDILNRAGQNFALVAPNIINFEGFSSLLFKDVRNEANSVKDIVHQDSLEAAHADINIDNHCLSAIYSLNL